MPLKETDIFSASETVDTTDKATVEHIVARLAQLKRTYRNQEKKADYSELKMMLCQRKDQQKWLVENKEERVSSIYFGNSYFGNVEQYANADDWLLWLVDKHLIPVSNSATLREWRNALPLQDRGFSWSGLDYADKPYISLSDHPELAVALLSIPNLVDSAGSPIECSEQSSELKIRFKEDGDMVHGVVSMDPNVQWVGDSLILDNKRLLKAPLTKTDMSIVHECATEFPLSLAGEVLSIIFSILSENRDWIEWEGKRIRFSHNPVKRVNTVLMESVDEQFTLTMRATRTIADFAPALCDSFPFSVCADVRDDEIVLRSVSDDPEDNPADLIEERIRSSVRSRKMVKGLIRNDSVFVLPQDLAEYFLYKELPWLLTNFKVLGSENLKAYKLRAAHPRLNCSLSSGIDFLEGEATIEVGEERFTLADILNQFRKNKYITLSDGNRVIVEDKYIKRLQRIFRIGKNKKEKNVKVSFFDIAELESLLDAPLQGEAFDKRKEVFAGLTSVNSQQLATPGLKGTLRNYQKHGTKWLKYLYDNNLGGCLADDMGLGKTIQTIALLTNIYPKSKLPTLIVMPRSLIFNWQEELKKFAPHLVVSQYYGTNRNLKEAVKAQVVLTTYAMVRNDIEQLKDQEFQLIVLDESQNIKNQAAYTTQAVWLLKAQHRLAISGTPIENNLDELYSLFRFLTPTMFGSPESFRENYTLPIQRDEDKAATESLRRKIYPFVLRRLKRDVLKDLPERTDQTIYVEMNEAQATHYERRRRYYKDLIDNSVSEAGVGGSQMLLFQALTELRRIASVPEALTDGKIKSAKLELLLENLTSVLTNGHKAVVFFNFIAGLNLVSEFLTANGIEHETMTGSTKDRGGVVERFQKDENCRVLLMTLKTGGVGLNLTAADTVFIFEPWWNKAAEEQGINRLHRIGQKSNVTCYSMIAKDTIEEKIRQLQEKKSLLVDEIISTDSSGFKNLTTEDIEFIFT